VRVRLDAFSRVKKAIDDMVAQLLKGAVLASARVPSPCHGADSVGGALGFR